MVLPLRDPDEWQREQRFFQAAEQRFQELEKRLTTTLPQQATHSILQCPQCHQHLVRTRQAHHSLGYDEPGTILCACECSYSWILRD